jgi:hypothetical protein
MQFQPLEQYGECAFTTQYVIIICGENFRPYSDTYYTDLVIIQVINMFTLTLVLMVEIYSAQVIADSHQFFIFPNLAFDITEFRPSENYDHTRLINFYFPNLAIRHTHR